MWNLNIYYKAQIHVTSQVKEKNSVSYLEANHLPISNHGTYIPSKKSTPIKKINILLYYPFLCCGLVFYHMNHIILPISCILYVHNWIYIHHINV